MLSFDYIRKEFWLGLGKHKENIWFGKLNEKKPN